MSNVIYLDNAATTQPAPEVVKAVAESMATHFANPSSIDHRPGAAAASAVAEARATISSWLGADEREIVLTSGATEANNLALIGTANRLAPEREIIVSAVEHPSVLEAARELARRGRTVHYLHVSRDGVVDLDALRDLVNNSTGLVSVQLVNNETGVVQPVRQISEIVRAGSDAYVHCDAVQGTLIGPRPGDLGVDLLSLSAHKFHGPKGVGVLYVKRGSRRVRIAPLVHGGGHERGLRAGTLNVAGIVGMATAVTLLKKRARHDASHVHSLEQQASRLLSNAFPGFMVNGGEAERSGHILSFSLAGIESAAIMRRLAGRVALSLGSACATSDVRPSHVLLAMGLEDRVHTTLRMSFSGYTELGDVEQAVTAIQASLPAMSAN